MSMIITVKRDGIVDRVLRGTTLHRTSDLTRAERSRFAYKPDETSLTVQDSPKMLRETLCVAQSRIGNSPLDIGRRREHSDRLQRLIDECDRHRPLGPGSKHGNRHTTTCGCDDHYVMSLLGFLHGLIGLTLRHDDEKGA